jgi:PhzF family phenazine biosynthesis protein
MEKSPVYFIDTFTAARFKGNPTAICLPGSPLGYQQMLAIAKEINLPVTAFVETGDIKSRSYNIHYFTSVTEIPACGHATLAAAKAMAMHGNIQSANFRTIEGRTIAVSINDDAIRMNYPVYTAVEFVVDTGIMEALTIEDFSTIGFSPELETLFIELPDPQKLRTLQPNFDLMVKSNDQLIEIVITSVSDDPGYDYLLRSFCPWIGINEDPVTGSVHSVLGGFWGNRLNTKNLLAYQASERGGEVLVSVYDDRIELGGQAVLVIKGEIYL